MMCPQREEVWGRQQQESMKGGAWDIGFAVIQETPRESAFLALQICTQR